ncbi:MAG: hypothetical protein J7L69_00435 [Desulfobulbaceae bacterium]|nr:hypothetical protein [Desulfobulbaceae bacterium]
MQIAFFISSHGFGHATRAIAVMQSMIQQRSGLIFHIFTTVPEWLFRESLDCFIYHQQLTDVGLVQHNALQENPGQTFEELSHLLPYDPGLIASLSRECNKCALILCDIAPLGIAVAKECSLPSALIENFTWDWIYQPYFAIEPRLQYYAEYLDDWFRQATFHIQTEPVCLPCKADLSVGPVFRKNQSEPAAIRKLFPANTKKSVLISMGGVPLDLPFLKSLTSYSNIFFIVAGTDKTWQLSKNALLLGQNSGISHVDLVSGCDALICKVGYSTLAEAYQAGVPVGYISRKRFPEAEILVNFIERKMTGTAIGEEEFLNGKWLGKLPELLSMKRGPVMKKNGADQIADFLLARLAKHKYSV